MRASLACFVFPILAFFLLAALCRVVSSLFPVDRRAKRKVRNSHIQRMR